MRRRVVLTFAGAGTGAAVAAGCAWPGARAASSDRLALGPARAHALRSSDLPGFTLSEELSPTLVATGLEDPYGRLGSYSATFVLSAGGAPVAEVTSSVNTYSGSAHARAAFEAWQAAVPHRYRPSPPDLGLPAGDGAAFRRDDADLIGFRVRNVVASVLAPHDRAVRLARLMIARIDSAIR